VLIDAADAQDELAIREALGDTSKRPLQVGDRLDLNDHEMVVVGRYRRTTEFFWDPLIYTTYTRALAIAPPERRMLNFVLARVKPGYDHDAVAAKISELSGLQAYTEAGFEARSEEFILRKTGILANFGITIALGFVIGVLISGQLLYNFILDNQRSFAAMKAMGASNFMLLRMVAAQVLFAAFVGFGIGVGLTALSGNFLEKSELAFNMAWQVPVFGGIAILICCLFAAALSISRVLRLEPAVVFKG
jgi:putative ABC transport system permease protein